MPPIASSPAPTRQASPLRYLAVVLLGLGGLGALTGYLVCGDRKSPSAGARAMASDRLAGLRPMTSGRVPKLRLARPQKVPALGHTGDPPPPELLPPRERLAPLITMYGEFFDAVGLEATEMRELRRLLFQAHQFVLRAQPQAGQPAQPEGELPRRRAQALALFQKELENTLRPDQAERVMAHPFVKELLNWNEPFFESDARGLASVRADLMSREAKGATYIPEPLE